MKLEFTGIVSYDDPPNEFASDRLTIGGTDILDALLDEPFKTSTVVLLDGKEITRGRVSAESGWGYSEYSPMESDYLAVNDINLVDALEPYHAQVVHLIVTDEI